MPNIDEWQCVGDVNSYICTVTATSSQPTSTPLKVQDSGNVIFGLAFIIFFEALIFLGLATNSFNFSSKKNGVR